MTDIRNIKIPLKIDHKPLSEREVEEQPFKGWKLSVEGEEFDFSNKKILYNRQDLAKHINENITHLNAQYWTVLSRRLKKYRDWAVAHAEDPEELALLMGLVQAFLTKVYGRIGKKLDETIDGVSFHLEDGELLINGINVNSCLKMVKKSKTKKSIIFLKGIRRRLAILQENRGGKSSYEKIRETVDRLAKEMDQFLSTHLEVISLPAPEVKRLRS